MKFNINNSVKVKLTDFGRKIHRENYNKIFEFTPQYRTNKYYNQHYKPKEDKDGWSKWQLWDLMSNFGHCIHLGGEVPFETEIEIIERENE